MSACWRRATARSPAVAAGFDLLPNLFQVERTGRLSWRVLIQIQIQMRFERTNGPRIIPRSHLTTGTDSPRLHRVRQSCDNCSIAASNLEPISATDASEEIVRIVRKT